MCTFFLVVAFRDARFLSGLYGRFSYIVALGLDDSLTGTSKDKPKARAAPKPKSDDDDVTEPVAKRRSFRHTGKVQHVELTDEDMLAEERESLRPKRETRVVNRFEDRQAAELECRRRKNVLSRSGTSNDSALPKRRPRQSLRKRPSRRLLSLRLRYSRPSALSTSLSQEGQ